MSDPSLPSPSLPPPSSSPAEPPRDDLDRLFARLDAQMPPPNFTDRVLAQTVLAAPAPVQVQVNRRAASLWGAFALVCLLAVGVSGYLVGSALASSDGLLLLQALADDVSLLLSAPGEVAAALGSSVPWALVVLSGFCAGLLTWAAGRVAAALSQPAHARGRVPSR